MSYFLPNMKLLLSHHEYQVSSERIDNSEKDKDMDAFIGLQEIVLPHDGDKQQKKMISYSTDRDTWIHYSY